ncbi:MAG: RimK/LysX family protein [Acidimicrobiia bacterium]|nr:RimK/LysX family protein [Acidimicrobiia bacterium]
MTSRKPKPLVGWREWVMLPDLCPVPMKAKIDTGARTSTLHAFGMVLHTDGREPRVEFEIHPAQKSRAQAVQVSYPIRGFKQVRSSTGHSEKRPVIRTPLRLGEYEFDIEVTLTARDEMGFRMLLGRAAVRRRFWIDPGRSFLHAQRVRPSNDHEHRRQP